MATSSCSRQVPNRPSHHDAPFLEKEDLWVSGEGRYHTYRIPSLLVTPAGSLLAFCEGRRHGRGDTGDIDLLARRSTDGGVSWGPSRVVWNDGANTCGNPCPVADRDTGAIWLFMTHNLGTDSEKDLVLGASKGRRTVWTSTSRDDGRSWSRPRNLSAGLVPQSWRWVATGPGAGIQTRTGRLVIPCDHIRPGGRAHIDLAFFFSHVIFSDDHGRTWRLGGSVGPGSNECEAVELADGRLLLNMRSYRGRNRRLVATSRDGGRTWSRPRSDPALVEPVCQASIRRLTTRATSGRNRLLFANPASLERKMLTVRLSYDEGRTWPVARVLHRGPAAYSCLAVLPNGTIACLYEQGQDHPYERLTLARFNLAWLARGKDRL